MKISVTTFDPLYDHSFIDFVKNHPNHTIFHSLEWAEVLSKTYKQLSANYLVARNEDGEMKGVLPMFRVDSKITGHRYVSLPFTLYCGILSSCKLAELALLNEAVSLSKKHGADYLEIRDLNYSISFPEFRVSSPFVNHILELDGDIDQVFKKFSRSNIRQQINKIKKLDFRVTRDEKFFCPNVFHNLFIKTRKKFGLPPQPCDFFMNVWSNLVIQGKASFYIGYYNNRPIGSVMVLFSDDRVHMEYAGLDYNYYHLKPSIGIYWQIIQDAVKEGRKYVEFGGSPVGNSSLRQFKKHWGASEVPISHYFYPEISGISTTWDENKKSALIQNIFKHTPNPVFARLGKFAYRHLGGMLSGLGL